jgi:hypothetical protein
MVSGYSPASTDLLQTNIGPFVPKTCEDIWRVGQGLVMDLNQDCYVDMKDLALFVDEWLFSNY